MSSDRLRAEIHRLGPWHHDVEVAPGIRTGDPVPPGTYPPELAVPSVMRPDLVMEKLVGDVYGAAGLGGRSMLDCGCNAGGYLFAAAKLGAGRGFGFDVREHWIAQARFLARHHAEAQVEFAIGDLTALAAMQLPRFDVTLFMGVFYHLPDPISGLRAAADRTEELLVINTLMSRAKGDALVLNPESKEALASGVHGLAWLPTSARVLASALEWCGFPHVRVDYQRDFRRYGRRIQLLAARKAETFAQFDAVRGRRATWLRRLLGQR